MYYNTISVTICRPAICESFYSHFTPDTLSSLSRSGAASRLAVARSESKSKSDEKTDGLKRLSTASQWDRVNADFLF